MKNDKNGKFKIHYIFLIIAFLAFITYFIIELFHFESFLNFIPQLLGSILILLFLICFIVISTKNKKQYGIIIVGSILITIYSIFNSLITCNVINLPNDEYVPNFIQKNIIAVNEWKVKNNIKVTENYEYSDTIPKDSVISQNELAPTLTKNITELTVTISLGPDLNKEIIIPSFIGLKNDDVLKYIEDNHLSNVKIEYQNSEKPVDTVISQSNSGTMKRNDEITIIFAKNNEDLKEVNIIDFTNQTELYAISWLTKYGFKYEIIREFDDNIEIDHVIKQNYVDEVKNPEEDTIILTISKGSKNIVPDISNMSIDDINKWAIENNIKINYKEEYSDTINIGDVITSSRKKDETISSGEKMEITISKGSLEMIKLTNINDFINWAENNNIDYEINYEYSTTYKKDEIIKCSHQTGTKIDKDDTIIITISKGKSITIPNFIGMSKTDIQNKCQSINLNCSFKTGGYTENTKAGIATGQSKKANTSVSEGTSLVITLSAGIQEKVSVPSFKGKSKSTIQTECNKIGIKCSFTYASGYSDTPKDTCISQNKTGTINKGSSVTITLSNGPAKTYHIIIDANQLSSGNPSQTKATLESKLKNNCPGVTFKFTFQKANSGIGYLAPNSQVKVGSNTLTQGKTYNVIINSN